MGEHPHVFPERHAAGVRTLGIALGVTVVMGAVELVAGLAAHSVALVGDALHMFTDTLALGLAFAAATLLGRAPSARHTFGYQRVEVLAALANGVLLAAVGGYVLWEALARFARPVPVEAPLMLGVAVAGLGVNLLALRLVHRGDGGLGSRAAALHIASDALTSVAAIVAAVLVGAFGWVLADPAAAVLIVAFVLRGAAGLVRDSGRILLEGAPGHLDVQALAAMLRAEPGVAGVHDLHLWSLTSGVDALTAHVQVAPMPLEEAVALKDRLKDRLHAAGVGHVVLEVDLAGPAGPSEPGPVRSREHAHGHPHRH